MANLYWAVHCREPGGAWEHFEAHTLEDHAKKHRGAYAERWPEKEWRVGDSMYDPETRAWAVAEEVQ